MDKPRKKSWCRVVWDADHTFSDFRPDEISSQLVLMDGEFAVGRKVRSTGKGFIGRIFSIEANKKSLAPPIIESDEEDEEGEDAEQEDVPINEGNNEAEEDDEAEEVAEPVPVTKRKRKRKEMTSKQIKDARAAIEHDRVLEEMELEEGRGEKENEENVQPNAITKEELKEILQETMERTMSELKSYIDLKFHEMLNDMNAMDGMVPLPGRQPLTSTMLNSTINNETTSYELPGIVKRRADRIDGVNKCIRFLGNAMYSREEFLNSTVSGTNAQGEVVKKLDEKKLEAIEDYMAKRFEQFGGVAKIREIVGKRCREIQRLARDK